MFYRTSAVEYLLAGTQPMIEGIEPFYQRLADEMSAELPEAWRLAWMDAIFYDDSITFYSSYLVDNEELCAHFSNSRNSQRTFREMRTLWIKAEKLPWCRARFALFSSGKFNLQLSYDDCDENGAARFDEVAERKYHDERRTCRPLPLFGAKEQIDPRTLFE